MNLPRWNFGKLLGVYVVLFFLFAQIIAKLVFKQPVTRPTLIGGIFIGLGGLIISFWTS